MLRPNPALFPARVAQLLPDAPPDTVCEIVTAMTASGHAEHHHTYSDDIIVRDAGDALAAVIVRLTSELRSVEREIHHELARAEGVDSPCGEQVALMQRHREALMTRHERD